jgi:NADH dehydrogenase
MKVLVTGGTGVVGRATVRELVRRGRAVRLFSRHAREDVTEFGGTVEARDGSIGSALDVRGVAEGCDAVLHVAGIVRESAPEVTFETVNVEGTRSLLEEAARAGARRFVYVSSLGAERGESDYHTSKRRAEELVRESELAWTIVRPGNVYGPGDEVVSLLLTMLRTLPAIPVIDDGDQPFQPIWAPDLARALATVLERPDLVHRVLDVAGEEITTTNAILDRFERITDKSRPRVPIPSWLASTSARLASAFGVDAPVNTDQITMLIEGNVIPADRPNALTDVLHIAPTPLDEALRSLADAQPEKLPSEGVGRLFRRRYRADIEGSRYDAEALSAMFRERFNELTPDGTMEIGTEPGTPTRIVEGATLTMDLPLRGTVQVRVEEVTPRAITFVTLEGHPLAGAIRFLFERRGDAVRFEVQTYDRAGSTVDRVAMSTIGRVVKGATWVKLVEQVIEASGGTAPEGVETETEALEKEQATEIERWVKDLVMTRRRETGAEV